LSLPLQAKLLRVLQEHEIDKVGGRTSIPVDVRVVATTNRDIKERIRENQFREDLYYRLNVFPIENPSLSERADDIPLLLKELMRRVNEQTGTTAKFTERAIESLKEHAWPGNIRELANLVERMVIMFPEKVVDIPDLPNKYRYIEVDAYEPEYPEELMEKDAFNDIFSLVKFRLWLIVIITKPCAEYIVKSIFFHKFFRIFRLISIYLNVTIFIG
jgi:sigma-54 specific flagellar transcriptional regulator A